MILPAEAGVSAGQSKAGDADQWIVGARPGPASGAIAAAYGATPINRRLGSYRIPRADANRLAGRLRQAGRLIYAEPDMPIERAGYPPDLLSDLQWWLNEIVSPVDVTPPPIRPDSPLIALIEESLDPVHPDLISANLTGARSLGPGADWHGTAIAGIIGSPGEMRGIRGTWPGARMRLFPSGLTCSTASRAVARAANRGAAVINMSYTFPARVCFTHAIATQYAVKKGAVPVAASGNSGRSGNAPKRPAVDPHVLSVGAVGENLVVSPFSTRNTRVDITAPGESIFAPVVSSEGTTADSRVLRNWELLDGTSFSAAMVSAAAAWLMQVRPRLDNLQVIKLLTRAATDLGRSGRDRAYGAGLLDIEGSLTGPHPPADAYEPNDDIRWVNGSLLKAKTPFLWRTGFGRRRAIGATLSRYKDPVDVYRVLIPARRRIVVNLAQIEGDVILSAIGPRARTIRRPRRHLIVRSNRPHPKMEGITIRNHKRRAQAIWLAVTRGHVRSDQDFRYRIRVVRR